MAEAIKQRIAIEGGPEVKATLEDVGRTGEQAFRGIQQQADQGGEAIFSFGEKLFVAGTVIAAAITLLVKLGQAFANLGQDAGKAANAIGQAAQRVGLSADAFQKVGFALGQAGLKPNEAAQAMERLGAAIDKAGQASGGVKEVFLSAEGFVKAMEQRRGIQVISGQVDNVTVALRNLRGEIDPLTGKLRQNEQTWGDFAQAIKQIPNAAERAKLVFDIFGEKIGRQLLPSLVKGRDGVADLFKEFDRLGLGISKADIAAGEKFEQAQKKLDANVADTKQKIGGLFTDLQTESLDSLNEMLLKNKQTILDWAKTIRDGVKNAQDSLSSFSSQDWSTMWQQIKSAASSTFEGIASGARDVLSKLPAAFRTVFSQIKSGIAELDSATGTDIGANQLWEKLKSGARDAWDFIKQLFGGGDLQLGIMPDWEVLKSRASEAWEFVKQTASGAWDFITSIFTVETFNAIWAGIGAGASSMWDQIKIDAQSAVDFIVGLWERVKRAVVSAGGDGSARETGGIPQMASGGLVRGPGSGTSDSILALLSNGEGILTARALRHYGPGIVALINGLRFPKFSMGGIVDGLQNSIARNFAIPRFAGGGLALAGASSSHAVTINFNGRSISGLSATSDALRDLQRASTEAQLSSAGRKPSWVR